MELEFKFDESIIYPADPTATAERIEQYKEYYKVKYDICKKQNPKVIAEIGVRAGYSGWTFLQACPDAEYTGFDANNGTHGGQGGVDGRYFEWAKKILSPYNSTLINIDTQIVDGLEIENVDFFHVDGDHTTKGIQHDLDIVLPTLSKTGLIVVDDTTYIDTVRDGVYNWLSKNSNKIEAEFVKSLRGEMLIRRK